MQHSRFCGLLLLATLFVVPTEAAPFDPFDEITGFVEAGAFFDGTTLEGQRIEEWMWIQSGTPFESVALDVRELGTGILWAGASSMTGERIVDRLPEFSGPGTPTIEGYEWRFHGRATASGLGGARALGTVDFTLSEAVRLLVRADFAGFGVVEIDNVLAGGFGPSLMFVPSPLYHEETILQPGSYHLTFECDWLNYRDSNDDGAIDLLLRFEPVKCGPADINTDGYTDLSDISEFIARFTATDTSVDLNEDGVLDHGDILAFIDAFFAGC
jgi:hypothetical protein